MDLVELNGEYEQSRIFMFLLFSWGLCADIAQNSENMRFLGGGRYTVRALYRLLLNTQTYQGTLKYKGEKIDNLTNWEYENDNMTYD